MVYKIRNKAFNNFTPNLSVRAYPASKTGINVMTRIMGLILAAIAVEVMAAGLVKIFPALGG